MLYYFKPCDVVYYFTSVSFITKSNNNQVWAPGPLMGVVSGDACAESRMCRHLVAPSFESQFFSGSCAFWTLSGYSICIVVFCLYLAVFICACLLGLLACSNYLLIIYWSAETDRVHCIVRVFVLLPL